jgi:hypothetical protein
VSKNNFKFNAAEVSLQAPVQVEGSALRPSRAVAPSQIDVDVTPRDPETGKLMDPLALDEFAIEAQSVTGTPRTDMCQILNLIEPPVWTAGRGHWRNATDGWLDSRADTVLTFDAARTLIDARIRELGLDRETVMAFPKRHFFFWQDWDAFNALSFDVRMEQFKRAKA